MNPNTSKAKGRQTENLLVSWLRSWNLPYVERRRLKGNKDEGDIAGIPGVVIEVKSAAVWSPLKWLAELDVEMENADASHGFIAARPKGKPDCDDWVALMRLPLLMVLLQEAGWVPKNLETSAVLDKALADLRAGAVADRPGFLEKLRAQAVANRADTFRGAPSDGRVTGWKTP